MTIVNATTARKSLYQLISDVNDTSMPVTITSKDKNAVLISEDDWHAIQETIYLNSVPGLVESILASDHEDLSTLEHFDPNEEW